jgi:hypothetical protein
LFLYQFRYFFEDYPMNNATNYSFATPVDALTYVIDELMPNSETLVRAALNRSTMMLMFGQLPSTGWSQTKFTPDAGVEDLHLSMASIAARYAGADLLVDQVKRHEGWMSTPQAATEVQDAAINAYLERIPADVVAAATKRNATEAAKTVAQRAQVLGTGAPKRAVLAMVKGVAASERAIDLPAASTFVNSACLRYIESMYTACTTRCEFLTARLLQVQTGSKRMMPSSLASMAGENEELIVLRAQLDDIFASVMEPDTDYAADTDHKARKGTDWGAVDAEIAHAAQDEAA